MPSLSDLRKEAEREGQIGSGVFKPQEGANRIRLLTQPLPHSEMYQGERRFKWLLYILDRADGQVKPYFLPHSIFKMVESLQTNEDWEFEGFPMPYDLTLTAKGAGTREVEYSISPSRKAVPLTEEEQTALNKKPPIKEFQKKLREGKGEQPHDDGARFDPDDDIPT